MDDRVAASIFEKYNFDDRHFPLRKQRPSQNHVYRRNFRHEIQHFVSGFLWRPTYKVVPLFLNQRVQADNNFHNSQLESHDNRATRLPYFG